MDDLKTYLIDEARETGICADGYSRMMESDMDGLVDYYIQNPDWCMERNFPDLDTLATEFSDIEDKGVYVNRVFHGELLNDLQVYIFHNCSGTVKVGLNVEKKIIPMLYVANRCRIRFMGVGDFAPRSKEDRTHIPIYSFGYNDIAAKDNRYVKFIHYEHDLI